MKLLRTAAVTGLVIAAVVVLALEPASGAGTASKNVAACSKAAIGSGGPNWRSRSIVAGPVGVGRHPLARMAKTPTGELETKMAILVAGHEPVTISVPRALRGRVFLYYGRIIGRDGQVTGSFAQARGYSETVFKPCSDKPRTVWPGGLRIVGPEPVRLLVHRSGKARPAVLRLGRPQLHEGP